MGIIYCLLAVKTHNTSHCVYLYITIHHFNMNYLNYFMSIHKFIQNGKKRKNYFCKNLNLCLKLRCMYHSNYISFIQQKNVSVFFSTFFKCKMCIGRIYLPSMLIHYLKSIYKTENIRIKIKRKHMSHHAFYVDVFFPLSISSQTVPLQTSDKYVRRLQHQGKKKWWISINKARFTLIFLSPFFLFFKIAKFVSL